MSVVVVGRRRFALHGMSWEDPDGYSMAKVKLEQRGGGRAEGAAEEVRHGLQLQARLRTSTAAVC